MRFAVVPTHERGMPLSDKELNEKVPLVGDLHTYLCPREPGGPSRTMVGLDTPVGSVLKPIIEPRLMGIGQGAFHLRGLEELKTERGWVYVLQEWRVTEVR